MGIVFTFASILGRVSFLWFVPAVLLAAGVLFSVIYCWPIPQPPAAKDGVGAEIAAAGEPPSGEGTEGPPGGELESGEEIEMETIDEAGRERYTILERAIYDEFND